MGQHIVWFRRYLEGNPISNSAIGDFFLASNGVLFRLIYSSIAVIGLDPVAAAWVIGLGSATLAAFFAGRFARAAGARSLTAAFVPAALILFLSFRDDAATGSARAIGWAILAATLWMLAERRRWGVCVVLCIGALIYPPIVALALCIMMVDRLCSFYQHRDWADLLAWGMAGAIPAMLVLATLVQTDPWGPTVTLAEAQRLPDFQQGGRAQFFGDWARFWITGSRSGLIPSNVYHAWPLVIAAICGLFCICRQKQLLYWNAIIILSGIILWTAAHITLFTLYLPSRFPSYSFGIVIALSVAGFAERLCDQKRYWIVGLFTLAPLLLYFAKGSWPYSGLKGLDSPELAPVLLDHSKHGLVAGLSPDLDRLPIAVSRTVFWSWETALPYKSRYRTLMRDRLRSTVLAVLDPSRTEFLHWASVNDVAFILLPKDLFDRRRPQRWETMLEPAEHIAFKSNGAAQGSWIWAQRLGPCTTEGTSDWLVSVTCLHGSSGEKASE